ncbi:MAG: ferredoxin [Acidimicrobiales bacterium]
MTQRALIRIEVDRERCVGSGNCLFWAPGTFTLDDDGISVVIDPSGDDEDRILVAAEGCPTRAISVERVGARVDTGHEQEEEQRADRTVR